MTEPLLCADRVTMAYGTRIACRNVSFTLYPGEVLGIVGESGSGKSSLLAALSGRIKPQSGTIRYQEKSGTMHDIWSLSEAERRRIARTDWGMIHQNPRDGLRLDVSAGANIGERLMALGARHYGRIRREAESWLQRVEIPIDRVDDAPSGFSGGMQQRLQIARNLVTAPRLVLMDEPTGGLDVSVQARLLDLIRRLTRTLDLAIVIVTHDLGVARLLADHLLVMQGGDMIEQGLSDRVLDDPQHPYTQRLVSSILMP